MREFLKRIRRNLNFRGFLKLYRIIKRFARKVYKKIRVRYYKYLSLRIIYPFAYYKNARKPIDPNKIVFVELRLPTLTNSFKLIYDELAKNYDYDLHCHFLRNGYVSLKKYIKRSREMMEDVATAKYVFINEGTNVLSCVKMRKETIVTQTWHGCGAFKKFGFSTAELLFGESLKEKLRFPHYKNYTHLTISSPEVAWAYEEAMNLYNEKEVIKPIGTSRTDVFYDEEFTKAAYEKLHAFMPSSVGKKVILYAPTFRGRVAKAEIPPMLNIPMFMEELGDEYVLVLKYHPLVRKPRNVPVDCREFCSNLTDAMSIEELLAVSDICISDYSSLVFEYSIYERPLIFFSYDLDEYFDWRGFYYDYDELAPGPVFKTNVPMIDYIKNIDTRFDKERVHAFREKFMSSCDGHATERLMDLVFGDDLNNHKKEIPLEGTYHDLPNFKDTPSARKTRLENAKKLSLKANRLYKKYSKRGIVKDKVLMLYKKEINTTLSYIAQKLEGKKNVTFLSSTNSRLRKLIKEMATSETIFITTAHKIINLLDIREDTKVVQLWDKCFPFETFGYSTRKVLSGMENDRLDVMPLHKNYSLVPIASDALTDIYKKSFNISDENTVKPIGNATTDLLVDENFKAETLEKLHEFFPESIGKKIIVYLHKPRKTLTKPSSNVFIDYKEFNEYLSDEYVLLFYWKRKRELPLAKYHTQFMHNVFGELSLPELMAVADIMIGDYRRETFTFSSTRKPILLYTPDINTYFYNKDTCFDYKDIAPGPIFSDPNELTKAVLDIENYDYTALDNFRNKYLANCDGHVTDRIIEEIL